MNKRKTITIEEWNEYGGSFTEMANAGDIVDNEIMEYFRDVLPPNMKRNKYAQAVQCSEPLTHDQNGALYITFIKFNENIRPLDKITPINHWIYYPAYHVNKILK
jgi:hypothetical protein